MKHSLVLATSGLLLLADVAAQNPLGTFTNMGTTFATRGGTAVPNSNNATLFTRHDMEAYAGWTDGAQPFTRDIAGINFVLQDENLATQHNFNLVYYPGDPLNADFPDINNGVVGATAFVLPLGTGIGAFNGTANFATPILASSLTDAYVGIQINSPWTIVNGQITDGLSVWECRSTAPTTPVTGQSWDEPGGSIPSGNPANRFSGFYVATPPTGPSYPIRTQYKIQPLVPISGGVAGALTNQTGHPESTATATAGFAVQDPGAGTACMFSALYPDAAAPPANTGRVDEISQMFENPALAAGSPVFFLIDIGAFGPEVPARNFVPGSTGVSCLSFGTMQNLGFSSLTTIGTTQRARWVATFPAAARPLLSGIDWLQQAVALDIGTNSIHASACTRQRT